MAQQQNQPAMEHQREPCPDRIIDDIGGAFAMGAVGGGAWHLVKGLKNSPSGFRMKGALEVCLHGCSYDGSPHNHRSSQDRTKQGLPYASCLLLTGAAMYSQSLRRESPRLGGSFANWGLTFSVFDCSLQAIRKKVRMRDSL